MSFDREIIRSRDNPKIKLYRKLAGAKKERYRYRLFVLEGMRLVYDGLKTGADIKRIFITPSAMERYGGDIENIISDDTELLFISDETAKYISDTENTQGIFAQCTLPENRGLSGGLKKGGRYIVLYRLQDPGNAGMIIRTADALGLDGVIFCGCCDVYSPKVLRATMGSVFRIPVYSDVCEDSLFISLSDAGLDTFAAVVDPCAQDVRSVDLSCGGAVFIGNEGNGLDREITEKCLKKITIRMNGSTESLNAAMAAGIIMWELMRFE